MQCAGMIPLPVSFFPLSLCRIGCKEEIALALQSAIAIPSLWRKGVNWATVLALARVQPAERESTKTPRCNRRAGASGERSFCCDPRPHWPRRGPTTDADGATGGGEARGPTDQVRWRLRWRGGERKARRRPAAKLAIVSFIVTIIVAVAAAADGRAGARLVGSRKGGELAR